MDSVVRRVHANASGIGFVHGDGPLAFPIELYHLWRQIRQLKLYLVDFDCGSKLRQGRRSGDAPFPDVRLRTSGAIYERAEEVSTHHKGKRCKVTKVSRRRQKNCSGERSRRSEAEATCAKCMYYCNVGTFQRLRFQFVYLH